MLSYKKQLFFLIVGLVIFMALFFFIYGEVKKRTIAELNNRQMVHAELAANGIEESFNHHFKILQYLADQDDVVRLNARGKELMRTFQQISSDEIRGVTRLDARGKIIYSIPHVEGIVGSDISGQAHVREVMRSHKPVMSDVFIAAQGFQAIALHVPVLRGDTFDGTVAFLISFDAMSKKYLQDINIEKSGYAWMISEKGVEIFCPIPGHSGNSVFETCKDFPDILEMAREMMKGKRGVTTYTFRQTIQSGATVTLKKHAVYMPVKISNTFWSIVVATPEDTVLEPMNSFRNQLAAIMLILFFYFAAIIYSVARIQSAAVAREKRRKIEADLIQSAQEVHDLYNHAPCGYHSLDVYGNTVRMNDTELNWLGYTREELIGKPYNQVLSPISHEDFTNAFVQVKKEGVVRDVEYNLLRKDGSTFPVLVTASAVTGPQGEFVMTRSMVQDITERRRQEEHLRESEALYRTALENTNDGISIVYDKLYVYVNKRLMETIGRPDENLVGKPAGIFTHPEDQIFMRKNYEARLQGQPIPYPNYEMRVIRPDQSIVHTSVSSVEIIYQGQDAVLAFITDITERKKAEAALRESETIYRTALESTSDGVSIVQDGRYVYINQKFLHTLHIPHENPVGKPVGVLIHRDDQKRIQENYEKRLRGEPTPGINELRIIRPDRTMIYVSSSSVDILYQGKPAVISFIRDITEQKKTEQALRESEELYRKSMETTSDGITIADIQTGIYLYANQRLMNTIGRPDENLTGKSVDLFIHPDDLNMGKKYFKDRKKSEAASSYYEQRVFKPDGSVVVLGVTGTDITYQGKKAVIAFISDITERKRADEALRESEALYRTAMETTNDGISIVQDNLYVYANQKLLKTIGREEEGIVGLPLGIYTHPDDRNVIRERYEARHRGEDVPSNYDVRIVKPDGSIVLININAAAIIYQGKPATLSFILDITEHKKAEEALRQSEELYRTAMENINDGISIVQEGIYVYANQKLLKTIGREETGLVNLPLGAYFHPDDLDMVKRYFVARIQGEYAPPSYDIRVMKPDGSYITLNIKAIKIVYKGKPATLSSVLDVTERNRAEEALRQSEERYRTIIESIDDDYFETDLKGHITFVNKPFSWLGRSREEMLGMNHRQYTTPEMADKARAAFERIYQDGMSRRITDYEVLRKDGSVCHLEMSVSLIRDAEGKPAGFRGISRDVSERINMEQEHKKLTEQLYQAQKMEAIGTLAGGIAHDFNNLLMGVQGYTSIMLLEVDATHPYYEQLKAIQTLVQSGASLTKQLLGFARAGRYEVKPTDLNDLISKSVNLFSRTRKEIRIYEKYADNIKSVEVDRGQIEQVLLNLFVNSWQAMPGGGSIYVETENVVFDKVSADLYDLKAGHYVKVSVTDTGVGMDAKTKQRIFDPFFTTKEMGRGTGLGLASAYGIIKGHGGMITVYSEKGQGTTFHIYLPASKKKATTDETPETELKGGRETILLVDDEEVITEVTSRLLSELGYSIITAESGEKALDIYRQSYADIQLVILDMIMPGMSGGETFEQLKAVNPSVRAILSSGYSIDGKAQAIMKKGVRVFLQKPYRLHDLAHKIREALSD